MDTPHKNILAGGFWVTFVRICEKLLEVFLFFMTLDFLSPADYGVFIAGMLIMGAMDIFLQTGLNNALIKEQSMMEYYLNCAWTVQMIRGIIIFSCLCFCSGWLSVWFSHAEARSILPLLGLTCFISGFKNIGVVYFEKDMVFSKRIWLNAIPALITSVFSVVFLFFYHDVRSLAVGMICGAVAQLILSYVIHGYRPRFELHPQKFLKLIGFGRWISLSGMLHFFIVNVDKFFVGLFMGPSALGIYRVGCRLGTAIVDEGMGVAGDLFFPVYCRFSADKAAVARVYIFSLKLFLIISFLLNILLFIFADYIVHNFMRSSWSDTVFIFRIFLAYSFLSVAGALSGSLFQATNSPQWSSRLQLFRLLVISVLLLLFVPRWGMVGAASSLLLSVLLVDPVTVYFIFKKIGYIK